MKHIIFILTILIISSCNNSNSDLKKEDVKTVELPINKNSDAADSIIPLPKVKLKDSTEFKFEDEYWAYLFENESIEQIKFNLISLDSTNKCDNWNTPTESNLNTILEELKWQHSSDIHYVFDHYNCFIEGEIKTNKKSYLFNINAGGFISISNSNGKQIFYLGAEDKELNIHFLSIKMTPEQLEELMSQEPEE